MPEVYCSSPGAKLTCAVRSVGRLCSGYKYIEARVLLECFDSNPRGVIKFYDGGKKNLHFIETIYIYLFFFPPTSAETTRVSRSTINFWRVYERLLGTFYLNHDIAA